MKKLTDADAKLFGKLPDAKIAEAVGMHKSSVCVARRKLGIAPSVPKKSGKYSWTAENVSLLGTMPDTKIAERLGLAQTTVMQARVRRGIPPFDRYTTGPTADAVRSVRLSASHTQKAAGALVGLSQSTWCAIERGACHMPPDKWAIYLEIVGQLST